MVWGLASQLAQPLFNFGLRAESRAAKAAMDAAEANYRQTVLQSFRNVADTLQALAGDAAALAGQTAAHENAVESLRIAQLEYTLGAADHLQVLIAHRQADGLRIAAIESRGRRLSDTIALYGAMGGE
jgi:outer membrane protein TolC